MKSLDSDFSFSRELATYERHRLELVEEYPGKMALFRGDELVGIYDDPASAIEEGHRRFGDNFLIQGIGESADEMLLGVFPTFPEEV